MDVNRRIYNGRVFSLKFTNTDYYQKPVVFNFGNKNFLIFFFLNIETERIIKFDRIIDRISS